jgi:hypothetical protein
VTCVNAAISLTRHWRKPVCVNDEMELAKNADALGCVDALLALTLH